jgi:hypothetical protein
VYRRQLQIIRAHRFVREVRIFIGDLVPNPRVTRNQILWTIRIAATLIILLGILALVGWLFSIPILRLVQVLLTASIPVVIAVVGNRYTQHRAQEGALQAYLDQMSDMLIPNKERPSLYKARPGDSLSSMARARTLTVLTQLSGDRKASVLKFLYEATLIGKDSSGEHPVRPVVLLSGADLQDVNLSGAILGGADLSYTDLSDANLFLSCLRNADLSWANLSGARLRHAFLEGANLSYATVRGADLSGARLEGTIMPNERKYEDWLDGLRDGLRQWRFGLVGSSTESREIIDGDLSSSAQVWAQEYLDWILIMLSDFSKHPLYGTIMPSGQKYEDWLKDTFEAWLKEDLKVYEQYKERKNKGGFTAAIDSILAAFEESEEAPKEEERKDKEDRGEDGENNGP